MTITHADFFRILPKALGSHDYQRQENMVCFRHPDYWMEITLSPELRWTIAGLELPATEVKIVISGCDEVLSKSILSQFDQSFQRGGG